VVNKYDTVNTGTQEYLWHKKKNKCETFAELQ